MTKFILPLVDTVSVRRTLADIEKQVADLTAERKKYQDRARESEKQIRDLKEKLSQGVQNPEADLIRQHLVEELEDERERHQKNLTDRDFTIDQTRKKYQGVCRRSSWVEKELNPSPSSRTCPDERGTPSTARQAKPSTRREPQAWSGL